jgi:hypothetical protein
MSLSWIDHQGTRILLNDFRGLPEPEAIAQLEEEVKLLESQPDKVRMLVDVRDAPIMRGFLARATSLAPRIEARLTKQAILGVTGVKGMLLSAFNLVSKGVPLRPFGSEADAKRYLADA